MLGYFFVLGTIVILIHLFFGELALNTPDFKRLPGFAKIYLEMGRKNSFDFDFFGFFWGNFGLFNCWRRILEELFSPIFGGNTTIYTLFYFAAGAILIYFGIKAIAKIDFWD